MAENSQRRLAARLDLLLKQYISKPPKEKNALDEEGNRWRQRRLHLRLAREEVIESLGMTTEEDLALFEAGILSADDLPADFL